MGGHSSREGLDIILLASEIEILSTSAVANYVNSYVRLVDDISLVINARVSQLQEIIKLMGTYYPLG